eukprot:CAMPEP_0202902210 /NCGR_PEP_ID=MMETSP1392-20130828/16724_1 /ASSEMBLY_ACC=CAM_ASM_000868 /TAXON_ID=225041 /ORGANISM="Chlamydomonas chlamydogama, Strain SAG 11-48b" /LENGTH=37 /DNA_ID= /DNA_START= /DNA_END= /DNA_ORIENTATION=
MVASIQQVQVQQDDATARRINAERRLELLQQQEERQQ